MKADLEEIEKIQKKLINEKSSLIKKLDEEYRKVPEKSFFKSTCEIKELQLDIEKSKIRNDIQILEQKIENQSIKFKERRDKQKKIDRANKIISQMKVYKKLITSKDDVSLQKRNTEYFKLYGICESLQITINLADSMFREIEFNDYNEDFLSEIIDRLDDNLISEQTYLDIVFFDGNEVFEKSNEIDKENIWLNW